MLGVIVELAAADTLLRHLVLFALFASAGVFGMARHWWSERPPSRSGPSR